MEPNPFKAVLQHRLIQAQWSMSYGLVFSLVSACRKLFFQNVIIPISLMYWDYARLEDMIPHLFFFSLSFLSYSSTRCSLDDSQTMKFLQLQCCCIKMGHNKYKDIKLICILLTLTVSTVNIHCQPKVCNTDLCFKKSLLCPQRLHWFNSKCSNTFLLQF